MEAGWSEPKIELTLPQLEALIRDAVSQPVAVCVDRILSAVEDAYRQRASQLAADQFDSYSRGVSRGLLLAAEMTETAQAMIRGELDC